MYIIQGWVWVLSCFSLVYPFATPWTVAHQAPLSIGFSRQEYWNGLPCPPPGDLPNLGIEPVSPTGRFCTTIAAWEAPIICQAVTNGTPLQYSCLENPMDGGAW